MRAHSISTTKSLNNARNVEEPKIKKKLIEFYGNGMIFDILFALH